MLSTPTSSNQTAASPIGNDDSCNVHISHESINTDKYPLLFICAEKKEELIQEIKSAQSSPCDTSEQQLSPCAVDSLKKVNSLKKDFQAGFQKIEKNIQKECIVVTSTPPAPSLTVEETPITSTTTTTTAVTKEGIATNTIEQAAKVVKVEKELFKDKERENMRAKVKPQRQVASTSRLLVATRSNSAKRVMSSKREEQNLKDQQAAGGAKPRCASTGVRRRPTQPQAPTFMSRPSRPSDVKLTSEEMELQALEKEKKETEKQMKSYQKTFQVLKTKGAIPTTVRSVKELTIPMTPSFPTDDSKRRRVFPDERTEDAEKKVHPTKTRSGPTIPAPFHFATTQRASMNGSEGEKSHDDVHTSGESIEQFLKNTRSTYVPKKAATGVTHAKAPTFRSDQRANSVGRPKPLSRDELEEKEMKAAQAMAFKAKPVNKHIFDSMGVNGVPKVQVKEPTTFSEFHLSCDDRAAYHKSHKPPIEATQVSDKTSNNFKALEMPDFSKPAARSCTPTNRPKPTEATSPKLSGGQRSSSAPARRQKPSHDENEKKKRAEANAWRAKIKQKQELTNPVDMHLKTADRGKASRQALEDRVKRQMLEEKQATVVHATPLNEKILRKSFAVSTSQKELTEFSEFKFQTDERHSSHQEATVKSMENMQLNIKNMSEFHARPVPASTHKPGFKPTPSGKEPVTPQCVHLSSEERSLQRKSFDATVSKNKQMEEELKDKRKAIQQDKENTELNKLRRTAVSQGGMAFKASKVVSEDPFPSRNVPSTPLTEPRSPQLRTALRARVNE